MEGVVNDPEGTGYAAHRDDILLAGKTGTAELKATKEDTSAAFSHPLPLVRLPALTTHSLSLIHISSPYPSTISIALIWSRLPAAMRTTSPPIASTNDAYSRSG